MLDQSFDALDCARIRRSQRQGKSGMAGIVSDGLNVAALWQSAEIDVGRLISRERDPRVARRFAVLDRVNVIADAASGLVWRFQGEAANATDLRPAFDPRCFVKNEYIVRLAGTPTGYPVNRLVAIRDRRRHSRHTRRSTYSVS